MDKVTFVDAADADGIITKHAIIDRGNGEFTSMTKEHYDELQAAKENANKL
jgi:hypothetical protein